MNPDTLQRILRGLFGDAASVPEAVAQTDRGAVWAFSLAGDYQHAWQNWDRLREALAKHELWPLVAGKRGEEEDVRVWSEAQAANTDYTQHDRFDVLTKGLALDVAAWLREQDEHVARWRSQDEAYRTSPQYQDDLRAQHEWEALDEDGSSDWADEEYLSAYPDDEDDTPQHEEAPQVLEAPRNMPRQDTWLMLVPARHGWEVPATLCFGGWNACPSPQQHVALIYDWHERYGAQLSALGHDTMLFRVAHPPQDFEEALYLARQQWYFCSGDGWPDDYTPEQLAKSLVNRTGWGFWWD